MGSLTFRSFRPDLKAVFLSRPNRFLVIARPVNGSSADSVTAHCPNPGRMRELLQPGRTLYLERNTGEKRKTDWTLAAADYDGRVIPLVSVRANDVAGSLVLPRLFPGAALIAESRLGNSRIDWLADQNGIKTWIEVKACTLIAHGRAMFPDAPSQRAVKHLEELITVAGGRSRGEILFVVMNPAAESLSPNPHTDPQFTLSLHKAYRSGVTLRAVSVETDATGMTKVMNPNLPVLLDTVVLAEKDEGLIVTTTDFEVFELHHCPSDLRKVAKRYPGSFAIRGSKKNLKDADKELKNLRGQPAFIQWLLDYRHRRVFMV